MQPVNEQKPTRIVIVGGGSGGLKLATRLGHRYRRRSDVQVTLVDGTLTHVWKPLLHEIAAGKPGGECFFVPVEFAAG